MSSIRKITGFDIFAYIIITAAAAMCLYPFILLVAGSVTDQGEIIREGFKLIPNKISFKAYEIIFERPETVLRAYGVSLYTTIAGTLLGLFVCTMAAYVLSRPEFIHRKKVSFYFYFTMLFGGGLVPYYILIVRYLQLKNNLLVLILPGMVNVFNLFILRSFISGIPNELVESAQMDGAGHFRIYRQVIMPMSGPALATIGLFMALGHWNDWMTAMLFIEKSELFPLQYLLYNILNAANALENAVSGTTVPMSDLPTFTLKFAMAVVATGPMMLAFPFVQKYFVKGLTIGAVKG